MTTSRESVPEFTVGILTTERRKSLLQKTLKSLEKAVREYEKEVTVLLGGADIATLVEELDGQYDIEIDNVETDGSLVDGRQSIIDASPTEWVLFVDNDCIVHPEILNVYAEEIRENDADKLGALYGVTKFHGEKPATFDACRIASFTFAFYAAKFKDRLEWGPTSNALFSTTAVNEIGGFSKEIPINAGSDVDIGIRLADSEYENRSVPKARVLHTTETWNSLYWNCRRFITYGRSEAWLAQAFPARTELSKSVGKILLAVALLLTTGVVGASILGLALVTKYVVRWHRQGRATKIRSYAIADLYKFVNTTGYYYQCIVSDRTSSKRIFYKFRYYT